MKKYITLLIISAVCIMNAPFVYSDAGVDEQDEIAAPAAPKMKEEPKRFNREAVLKEENEISVNGTLDSVEPSGLKMPKAKIAITDENGAREEFSVKSLAVIYDPSGNIISLHDVKEGEKVQVNYRSAKSGPKEATSIKVMR